MPKTLSTGEEMISLMKRLWPLNRSISGQGLRETLHIIKTYLPELKINEVKSGTRVLDWIVPDEWEITEAFIKNADGETVIDLKNNNLHVIGYSTAVNKKLYLEDLLQHIYTLPDQPYAIPYVTSYYQKNWGFCMTDNMKQNLNQGQYHAYINSRHFAGSITYAELYIPGKSKKEVFISTYCCHPSMANNELSGPCVSVALACWLNQQKDLKYSYRFVFTPEMIGSAAVLEKNKDQLKKNVIAAFNLTCVGDDRTWSYLPSRQENTYADKIALHTLKHFVNSFDTYSWKNRGSDESMYCAPHIDLPMVSVMRSKYETYPEYHTSLDKIGDVVTPEGLQGSLDMHKKMIKIIENDCYPQVLVDGEPQLGRRNLYPMISTKGSINYIRNRLDLISYSDGKKSLLNIADKCELAFDDLLPDVNLLTSNGILRCEPLHE